MANEEAGKLRRVWYWSGAGGDDAKLQLESAKTGSGQCGSGEGEEGRGIHGAQIAEERKEGAKCSERRRGRARRRPEASRGEGYMRLASQKAGAGGMHVCRERRYILA